MKWTHFRDQRLRRRLLQARGAIAIKKNTRMKHSPEFKAKVALAAIREQETVAEGRPPVSAQRETEAKHGRGES